MVKGTIMFYSDEKTRHVVRVLDLQELRRLSKYGLNSECKSKEREI